MAILKELRDEKVKRDESLKSLLKEIDCLEEEFRKEAEKARQFLRFQLEKAPNLLDSVLESYDCGELNEDKEFLKRF